MLFDLRLSIRVLVSCVLITLFALTPSVRAQSQVASPADIHKELVSATQTRQKNLEKAERLFSSEEAQKALKAARIDPAQVTAAVSTLSDAELARLASRADKIDQDFAAGQLSNRDLLIIIIGIAVVILIIVAVR
ncbi:MAG: PA2779 family protein [Blastocatellia bacterium]|nr:PA2779 family protein [Blastocatellia bacterium]